jgi:hypothetical protein
MPVKKVKGGYKWGTSGKVYPTKAQAERQGKAIKVTGKQRHLYNVSYKGEGVGEGICMTYVDASVVETVSYDYTADGWAYNSTDTTPITS